MRKILNQEHVFKNHCIYEEASKRHPQIHLRMTENLTAL